MLTMWKWRLWKQTNKQTNNCKIKRHWGFRLSTFMDSLCQHLCINGVIFLHKFIRRHRSCWAAELTLLWYQIVVATRTLCIFHASPHAWWVLLDHACVIRMPKKRVIQDGWLCWAAVLSWCVKLDKSENHSEREGCQKTRDSVFRLKKK